MKAHSVGREAAGSSEVEPSQEAGRHRIRYWESGRFSGQSGLRIWLGGKGPV